MTEEKTHFRRMDEGTDEDFQILAISEQNHWVLEHHGLFQTYFYGDHPSLDPNARDAYRDNPHFRFTVDSCGNWDEVSFDPDYPNEPLSSFEPIVRRVLPSTWSPPSPEND